MDFVDMLQIAALLAGLFALAWLVRGVSPAQTIFSFQAGLLYANGQFRKRLAPGRYRGFWPGTQIFTFDMRKQQFVIPGQELLTDDKLTVKISLVVEYKIADPRLLHESVASYYEAMYNSAQIALREIIAEKPLDAILSDRKALGPAISAGAKHKLAEIGLELIGLAIKDVMLSGETKRAFSDLFRAQKEGEAALERARGETAALRSLANGARMLKDNPGLYQLRLLQAISDPGKAQSTIVLNASGEPVAPVAGH